MNEKPNDFEELTTQLAGHTLMVLLANINNTEIFYTDKLRNMMNKIALIYGTDTGMTEDVTNVIKERWTGSELEIMEVCDVNTSDFDRFDKFILGLSTWYDGDLQSDWETFYDNEFQNIDFTGKTVAIFGLGDQESYAEFFVDGVGILADVILKNGGNIIGKWSTEDYEFEISKAQIADTDMFYGLALDELNEPDKSDDRIDTWLAQIEAEFKAVDSDIQKCT